MPRVWRRGSDAGAASDFQSVPDVGAPGGLSVYRTRRSRSACDGRAAARRGGVSGGGGNRAQGPGRFLRGEIGVGRDRSVWNCPIRFVILGKTATLRVSRCGRI